MLGHAMRTYFLRMGLVSLEIGLAGGMDIVTRGMRCWR